MAITNLLAKQAYSTPSAWVEIDVAIGDPKTLILTGHGVAEIEIAVLASDAAYYSLATLDRQDVLDNGPLAVPGTYQVRILKTRYGIAGLDVMDGS